MRPDFAIVDGILGMEGYGPLHGTPKASHVLVLGDDPVAVDATCARIMNLVPERVEYLAKAAYLLGTSRKRKSSNSGKASPACGCHLRHQSCFGGCNGRKRTYDLESLAC